MPIVQRRVAWRHDDNDMLDSDEMNISAIFLAFGSWRSAWCRRDESGWYLEWSLEMCAKIASEPQPETQSSV